MAAKLPAQIRVHIRDLIDGKDSEVQQTLKSLGDTIGTVLTLEIAWGDIFRDLKDSFDDHNDQLVSSVARHIIIFIQRLESVLTQDEQFQEKFLDNYASWRPLLAVVIQAGSKTSCKIANNRITLLLPTTGPQGFREAQTSVATDLPNLVLEPGEERSAIIEDDPEWDDVGAAPPKPQISTKQPSLAFQDTAAIRSRPLPNLKSLQRPEILFENLLPAFLAIRGNQRELFVEGSHSPTITLIAQYFKTFVRKDMLDANQSPRFKVEERTSNFGSGTFTDCIKLELWYHNRDWQFNVALLLAFVEGVCEYEMVSSKDGSYLYRRKVPF